MILHKSRSKIAGFFYSTQMQMAQIAEEIQYVQIAVEVVRKGQENDRLDMAYQEMCETESVRISLQYYIDYVKKTYLELPGFVQRLDMLDSSTKPYWSETIPGITKKIETLPYNGCNKLIEEID